MGERWGRTSGRSWQAIKIVNALLRIPRLNKISFRFYQIVAYFRLLGFDVDYCRAHGIAVSNVRDYAMHSVPEHVFALLLALRRDLAGYGALVRLSRSAYQRLLLELDPLLGAFEVDMQRLAQAVGVIPHAAEHRDFHDLLLGEVPLHVGERRIVVARGHARHRVGPADRRLLPRVERG